MTKSFLIPAHSRKILHIIFHPALTLRGPNRGHHHHPGRNKIPDVEELDSPGRHLCLAIEKLEARKYLKMP
jgi:hypothetical protein